MIRQHKEKFQYEGWEKCATRLLKFSELLLGRSQHVSSRRGRETSREEFSPDGEDGVSGKSSKPKDSSSEEEML